MDEQAKTELTIWCRTFKPVLFSRHPGMHFVEVADLVGAAIGEDLSPEDLLLIEPWRQRSGRQVVRLRWHFQDKEVNAELAQRARAIGGSCDTTRRLWAVEDADGTAKGRVCDVFADFFSHAVDLSDGSILPLQGASAPAVAHYGLYPELRGVSLDTVRECVLELGVDPRPGIEVFDRMARHAGFVSLHQVFGRPSAWPCFATRHALVLLRVHQAGSSTVIVEWDVAERRIRRWEYGKAAGHLLSVFGTSLDVLAEPVLAAASLDNCGIEPLLRLAEASVEHRTGFRLPLADARTTPDDGPAFLDALKPVRVDGARIERLWASDDVDKVDLIILGVFEAILAEIERSEAALDPATLERPGFLAALCAAIGRARGLVAGLVAGGALDLLPKQMRAALLGMLEPPGGDGQGGSLAA